MKTNSLILCVLCWLLGLHLCEAQATSSFRLGLTGGLNAAQLQQTNRSRILWRYNAGVTVEQRLSSVFAVAAHVLYSRQGSSTPVTGLGGKDKLINAFDYVSLPIMVRYSPKTERAFFEVGGQGGYLFSAEGYFGSSKNQPTTFRYVHNLDVGVTGGVGYRLSNRIVVDARYYHGIRPILANYTAPDPQTGSPTYYRVVKWYNRVWSLNLSYYLH